MRALAITVPLEACREHGSIAHRVCGVCHHGCLEDRYATATRCLNCASQRTGARGAFRSAYRRIYDFAHDDEGATV